MVYLYITGILIKNTILKNRQKLRETDSREKEHNYKGLEYQPQKTCCFSWASCDLHCAFSTPPLLKGASMALRISICLLYVGGCWLRLLYFLCQSYQERFNSVTEDSFHCKLKSKESQPLRHLYSATHAMFFWTWCQMVILS